MNGMAWHGLAWLDSASVVAEKKKKHHPACLTVPHPLIIMAQITDAQHSALAGLLKALGPPVDGGQETDPFEIQDDVDGEQEAAETLLPANSNSEGPSQVSDVLAVVGEASMAVKEATDTEYRR